MPRLDVQVILGAACLDHGPQHLGRSRRLLRAEASSQPLCRRLLNRTILCRNRCQALRSRDDFSALQQLHQHHRAEQAKRLYSCWEPATFRASWLIALNAEVKRSIRTGLNALASRAGSGLRGCVMPSAWIASGPPVLTVGEPTEPPA